MWKLPLQRLSRTFSPPSTSLCPNSNSYHHHLTQMFMLASRQLHRFYVLMHLSFLYPGRILLYKFPPCLSISLKVKLKIYTELPSLPSSWAYAPPLPCLLHFINTSLLLYHATHELATSGSLTAHSIFQVFSQVQSIFTCICGLLCSL